VYHRACWTEISCRQILNAWDTAAWRPPGIYGLLALIRAVAPTRQEPMPMRWTNGGQRVGCQLNNAAFIDQRQLGLVLLYACRNNHPRFHREAQMVGSVHGFWRALRLSVAWLSPSRMSSGAAGFWRRWSSHGAASVRRVVSGTRLPLRVVTLVGRPASACISVRMGPAGFSSP
jgi:hypothetical protein